MTLSILGESPFERDSAGRLKTRIATLLVRSKTLVTVPGVHATQRIAFTDSVNAQNKAAGRPLLTPDEECAAWEEAVDLILEDHRVLIRPDPDNMELALEADVLLQELVSKRNIRFLFAGHEIVREALRRRGELWRIAAPPRSPVAIKALIVNSRINIAGEAIYFYNMLTGTRVLTLQAFQSLARLDSDALRRHLTEIRDYASRRNRMGMPELAFFAAGNSFNAATLAPYDFANAAGAELRAWHTDIGTFFEKAVPPALRVDDPDNPLWRHRMFSRLVPEQDETVDDNVLHGISPEFFRQIRWFPGARIEDGELVFDPVIDEQEQNPTDAELRELCDPKVRGFICNYVREFGSLEHVNIGGVAASMRRRSEAGAHRAYIAELKPAGAARPMIRILRMQKWGIEQHLDGGKELLSAIMEAEEYTEYVLDRRLGCWELGMSLPAEIITHRITEPYHGTNWGYHGTRIWTTYFERAFIEGVATDKIPAAWFKDPGFCSAFARLLGLSAASNLIVGRTTLDGSVIFDDGDEILVLDDSGRPRTIIAADHSGTFTDCESPLERFAAPYARPVIGRLRLLPDSAVFAEDYLAALEHKLSTIQQDYRRRRRAFDTLFKHSKQDRGAFGWRWENVLKRLDGTDVPRFVARVRDHINPAG